MELFYLGLDIKKRNPEFTNSPILEFEVLHNGKRAF